MRVRRIGWYLTVVAVALVPAACDTQLSDDEPTFLDSPEWLESPARQEQLGEVTESHLDTLTAARLSGAFRAAADRALPSVVFIQVEAQAQARSSFRFFGPQDDLPEESGSGSGFIFDADGYILTNNHVVQNATSLLVRLVDGREYEAVVIGRDPDSDVAVIRIDPHEGEALPVAQIGNSNDLRVGDWVLALGSPFELDFTVTAGIVSAKGRNRIIGGDEMALEAFIQTDAAINPGNSGGPLVDLLGRVVGVSTAIYSPSGVYAGYGFAIPIQLATRVARDLVEYGVVRRPQLGVSVADVTADDAEYYGLDRVAGALVRTVTPQGPAERAGLAVGDVIVGIDSTRVTDATQLITMLAQRDPGDRVTLTFRREGRVGQVDAQLTEFERTAPPPEPTRRERVARGSRLSFTVSPLEPGYARRVGWEGDGVVIQSVERNSIAARRGLAPGMVLYRLNGNSVGSITDVERVISRVGAGEVLSLTLYSPQYQTETVVNFRPR